MRIPNPEAVNPKELSKTLELAAECMIRADGDRDPDSASKLTVEQSMAIARLLVVAGSKLALQDLLNELPRHRRE